MKKVYTKKILETIEGKLSVSEKFHHITKNRNIASLDLSNIPESWIKIHFKTYPRLNRILLKPKIGRNKVITSIINSRRSIRKFSEKPVSYDDLSYLLYASCGLRNSGSSINDSKRPYPSAGARYPLEVYLLILNCKEIKNGLYHYNVRENSLEVLLEDNLQKWLSKAFGKEEWLKNAAALIFITGVLDRTQIKYGDRGYRYMLIEVGHLAQNICLLATELGFGTCLIGGFIDNQINKLLDIDLQKEFSLYVIAIGQYESTSDKDPQVASE